MNRLHPDVPDLCTLRGEGYYLPVDPGSWSVPPGTCGYEEEFLKTLGDVSKRWKFLGPFFATHGYYVYQGLAHCFTTPPDNIPLPSAIDYAHPFSRRIDGLTDRDLGFDHAQASFTRDCFGREVVIRLVSFPGEESDELKIYCLLNTPQARKDPRNHTVPVIDWLEYSGLKFVVSPRWGDPLIGMVQLSTEQLLHYGDTLLEGLAFLHENRIAHRDVAIRNTVLDIIAGHRFDEGAALLDPSVARFAFIDFDASAILPMGTPIDNVMMEREMRIGIGRLGLPEGKSNPFKDDVVVLLHTLQTYTRVLEAEIPEIGLFFDKYLADLAAPPSAAVVLAAFRKLRSSLTREQLNHIPKRTRITPAKTK
ncbi:other/AgaK1 protein kinase [Coprinopsis sp. MPI-PUGE-AT-0042]|nr:other/AgaK1 protein kinase [Coprinopsis sp. MPI-PUGE-AT-0042]